MGGCECSTDSLDLLGALVLMLVYTVTAVFLGVNAFITLLVILVGVDLIILGYYVGKWSAGEKCLCRSYGDMILSALTHIVFLIAVIYLLLQ